jgi:tetratricopeptide (TPR) repeat protein
VDEAESEFNKGMDLLKQENYYDAMTHFTKSYNTNNNTRALFYSAEAAFQMAVFYLKDNAFTGWRNFSDTAYSRFKTCADESSSSEVVSLATKRMGEIKELQDTFREFE